MQITSYEVLEELKALVSVTTKQRTKTSPPAPRPTGTRLGSWVGGVKGKVLTEPRSWAIGSLAEAAW